MLVPLFVCYELISAYLLMKSVIVIGLVSSSFASLGANLDMAWHRVCCVWHV